MGTTIGENGAGVTLGKSWSYAVGDTVIKDQSTSNTVCNIWTDVDETKNVGAYTYYIQPGMTIRTPEGQAWNCQEYDEIVWGYSILWAIWVPYKTAPVSYQIINLY